MSFQVVSCIGSTNYTTRHEACQSAQAGLYKVGKDRKSTMIQERTCRCNLHVSAGSPTGHSTLLPRNECSECCMRPSSAHKFAGIGLQELGRTSSVATAGGANIEAPSISLREIPYTTKARRPEPSRFDQFRNSRLRLRAAMLFPVYWICYSANMLQILTLPSPITPALSISLPLAGSIVFSTFCPIAVDVEEAQ